VAYSPTYIRFASRNERRATDYRPNASRSLKHHDHDEIRACGSLNAANRDRHAEPKNDTRDGLWAPFGHRVVSDAAERNRSKKLHSKKPLIIQQKWRTRIDLSLFTLCVGGGNRNLTRECGDIAKRARKTTLNRVNKGWKGNNVVTQSHTPIIRIKHVLARFGHPVDTGKLSTRSSTGKTW
jgi:hypothetical protein